MHGLIRRRIFGKRPLINEGTKPVARDLHKDTIQWPVTDNELLSDMLQKYLGQTVTIFTNSGGPSGLGFTGVLMFADNTCVKLLTVPGIPPACPFFYKFARLSLKTGIRTIGSIAVIRIEKIAAFIHNAV
jgi:hypothetical protein